jgi:hypothetical protein
MMYVRYPRADVARAAGRVGSRSPGQDIADVLNAISKDAATAVIKSIYRNVTHDIDLQSDQSPVRQPSRSSTRVHDLSGNRTGVELRETNRSSTLANPRTPLTPEVRGSNPLRSTAYSPQTDPVSRVTKTLTIPVS